MKPHLPCIAPMVLMLVSPAVLADANTIFETGVVQKNHKATVLEANGQKVPSADKDTVFDYQFTALRLGLGALYRDVFAVVHYDIPLNTRQEDNASSEQAQREDYDLTLGYSVWQGISVYGGYKSGTTKVSQDRLVDDGMGSAIRITSDSAKIREHGPFLGFTYSYNLGDIGALSVNLAYADMTGSYSLKKYDEKQSYDARVAGYSYGLKWTGFLQGAWAYFVDARQNEYLMDLELDKATVAAPREAKFVETYHIYSIGFSRVF